MFDRYKVDMELKGVKRVQHWDYVVRICEWDDLMIAYPDYWKGVLQCTDSYETLKTRETLPRCRDFQICTQSKSCAHYNIFSHSHEHFTNVCLEMKAYNEALDAIGDKQMHRCVMCDM
jgi:hypothetical protein